MAALSLLYPSEDFDYGAVVDDMIFEPEGQAVGVEGDLANSSYPSHPANSLVKEHSSTISGLFSLTSATLSKLVNGRSRREDESAARSLACKDRISLDGERSTRLQRRDRQSALYSPKPFHFNKTKLQELAQCFSNWTGVMKIFHPTGGEVELDVVCGSRVSCKLEIASGIRRRMKEVELRLMAFLLKYSGPQKEQIEQLKKKVVVPLNGSKGVYLDVGVEGTKRQVSGSIATGKELKGKRTVKQE
ncbi:hypothetical protein F5051DRAFT_434411 [Lentinula edodes]|nr:hypothetical protein F5051DRAFT_434411 [Lentinula edodes]